MYLAWQNTHAPLQVPTYYCYNSSSGPAQAQAQATPEGARRLARAHTATSTGTGGLGMSSDCPSEGPKVKGHSWCYCYDNQLAHSRIGAGAGAGAGVHGNTTNGGTCSDRHTFNAMARVQGRSISPQWGSTRFRLALRTYDARPMWALSTCGA